MPIIKFNSRFSVVFRRGMADNRQSHDPTRLELHKVSYDCISQIWLDGGPGRRRRNSRTFFYIKNVEPLTCRCRGVFDADVETSCYRASLIACRRDMKTSRIDISNCRVLTRISFIVLLILSLQSVSIQSEPAQETINPHTKKFAKSERTFDRKIII